MHLNEKPKSFQEWRDDFIKNWQLAGFLDFLKYFKTFQK